MALLAKLVGLPMSKPSGLLAIDVGGSKTLFAVFSHQGEVIYKNKIKTNPKYARFLAETKDAIGQLLEQYDIKSCCCALPGHINHGNGVGEVFGNLKWRNVPIRHDLTKLLGGVPVLVENDAKLAGLSEALKHKQYKKVLYVTISTGIGAGYIVNGKLSDDLANSEPGQMMLEDKGRIKKWEDIASGRALVERFGQRAADLEDPHAWREFSSDIAKGLEHVIAVVQPEVVIIGGSIGTYFHKYGDYLKDALKKLENDMVEIPPILPAERAEEAVIYGCYEYIKQRG